MKNTSKNIAVLILAAGSSSRLGRPKQLLEIDGKTLLQKSILNGLEISNKVIVVLGANQKLIRTTISKYPVKIVINKNWEEGMSSSIRTGMQPLGESPPKAVLIMLTDQPFVNVLLLKKLIREFEKKNAPIIASEYGERVGVPAIFDISFFEKLKNLKGQKGAKSLIINHLEKTKKVLFENGEIDIDTEEDWRNFRKKT